MCRKRKNDSKTIVKQQRILTKQQINPPLLYIYPLTHIYIQLKILLKSEKYNFNIKMSKTR